MEFPVLVSNLGSSDFSNEFTIDRDVEYLVRINHAGRKFIPGGEGAKAEAEETNITDNKWNSNRSTNTSIKPQLWPLISDQVGI
jgi:hypothetical protein